MMTPRNFPQCFVCDQKIMGEKINLSSATAPLSQIGLPEKLSQLIGDEFVVVVTENDALCKRCASLLMHVDKLENELVLVKRAVITYVKGKYSLPMLENPPLPTKKNKDESTVDDSKAAEANPSPSTPVSTAGRKRIAPKPKEPPPPKGKPLELSVPKLKIFKCGFCSFQSKELHNVRLHMKLHVKAGGNDDSGAAPAQKPPISQASIKRRLFRCQVCSASFEERTKCLEHISKEHTSGGSKYTNADDKKKQSVLKSTAAVDVEESSGLDPSLDIKKVSQDSLPSSSLQFSQDTDEDSKDTAVTFSLRLDCNTSEMKSDNCILSDPLADKVDDADTKIIPSDIDSVDSAKFDKKELPLKKIITMDEDGPAFVEVPDKTVKELSLDELPNSLKINKGSSNDSVIKLSSTISNDIRDEKVSDKDAKKKVHSIDIEAMIAALHSDGPND